jgi:hypothetical protein
MPRLTAALASLREAGTVSVGVGADWLARGGGAGSGVAWTSLGSSTSKVRGERGEGAGDGRGVSVI